MRTIITVIFCLTFLLVSCGRRTKQSSSSTSWNYIQTTTNDSLTHLEQEKQKELYEFLIGDTLPRKTDGTFDDFIYAFASNSELQLKRIIFPLPYYDEDGVSRINEEDWVHDSLFINNNYYTLLFDTEEEMDGLDSLSSKSVQIELYLLAERKVKTYYFVRINDVWFMEAINLRDIEGGDKEGFFDFFAHFSADSLFQAHRIVQPLQFVTIDPDDEFSILETELEPGQWFAFRPPVPKDYLFNINYGQNTENLSNHKIVVFRGIGNGFFNALFFTRIDGLWKLFKFEDTSI
ncbi:MAG: DUF4348 domain-containing protein [Bacteroidales bacterium]|nr:DUF4348 domain-containing protein [Bacteroidales bacterium]